MKRNTIYLVDDNHPARRANAEALRKLLSNVEIQVFELEPLPRFDDYTNLLAAPSTAAFMLDQKMKQAGLVDYNGIDLAAYLRGIDTKMPIYILTGYTEEKETFEGGEYLVEYILAKADIINKDSNEAKIVKARILRHLNVFNDVLDEREQRFHNLLLKSLHESLTAEEEKDLGILEDSRLLHIQASELHDAKTLKDLIGELKAKLNPTTSN